MKVFISWSGERSRALAEILKDWINGVLQATDPWISTKDIDRGSIWFSEIYSVLADAPVGIICLTTENKDQPWILFEAGALAKGKAKNLVCTLLLDMRPADIEGPLAHYNHTETTRESMFGLIKSLNHCLGEKRLTEVRLNKAFDTYWPQFEAELARVRKAPAPTGPKALERSANSMLEEVLELTRSIGQQVLSRPVRYGGSKSYDELFWRPEGIVLVRQEADGTFACNLVDGNGRETHMERGAHSAVEALETAKRYLEVFPPPKRSLSTKA